MSVKDRRYCADCPICHTRLPGTDDAVMVFECLAEEGETCCTLCGEEVTPQEREAILAKGKPEVRKA